MDGQNVFCSYPSNFEPYSDGGHIKGEPMREMDVETLCKLYLRSKPIARISPEKQDPINKTRSDDYSQRPQYACRRNGPFDRIAINQHSVNQMYNNMLQYKNNYSMTYPQAYNVSYPNVPTMQYDTRSVPFNHQGYANGAVPFTENAQNVCYCRPYQRNNASSYHPYSATQGKENILPNGMPSSATKMKQPHNKASNPARAARTVFTAIQLLALEKKFQEKQYLTRIDRASLAVDLCMTEKQVKTWFQNRRTKHKDMQKSLPLY